MKNRFFLIMVFSVPFLWGCSESVSVGTIVSYAGLIRSRNDVPRGWLLCDGRALSSSDNNNEYMQLFNVIGTAWGDGTMGEAAKPKHTNFNLPDLRGMFLRGCNGNRRDQWVDPDEMNRTQIDGTPYAGVGSYQKNMFKKHKHGIRWLDSRQPITMLEEQANVEEIPDEESVIAEKIPEIDTKKKGVIQPGGKETRPNNVYVYYLIKY